ncbi:MAG: hypothetical protein UY81_C0010G0002 [Candidatus Giovannonibacteria bacterium GW2011_GWA2_53_7]|uniref:Uncharacterized protein n=1 Tax=Candidatus Giovannonibacteria bacterium GW2011_GWA2_53_7 TaxID=1618650 RepID=A0A0G1Y156_9BACT|nr:MAG: hypothetical protein UY81_C0010G0002 [Candidatus Giovannonibacteria bacterium GW2011_GWA2_53_7]
MEDQTSKNTENNGEKLLSEELLEDDLELSPGLEELPI